MLQTCLVLEKKVVLILHCKHFNLTTFCEFTGKMLFFFAFLLHSLLVNANSTETKTSTTSANLTNLTIVSSTTENVHYEYKEESFNEDDIKASSPKSCSVVNDKACTYPFNSKCNVQKKVCGCGLGFILKHDYCIPIHCKNGKTLQ